MADTLPFRSMAGSFAALSVILVLALALSGCGGASASSSSSSRTNRAADTPARLSPSEAQRLAAVCRRSETAEDRNVVVQFANHGASIFSPNAVAALKAASVDILRESTQLKATMRRQGAVKSGLTSDVAAEAQVLRRAAALQQLSKDEAALLSTLHRRMAVAAALGVRSCGGAPPHVLIEKVPA